MNKEVIAIINVRDIILDLKQKYYTSDPFKLADALKITIFYEELGTVNGYYINSFRMKQIHINSSLDYHNAEYTCAHELGHAIIHPNASTPFLRSNTLLSVDKMEIEANTFAINLLISDETITENLNYTTEQLSRLFGYDQALIELRLKSFKQDRKYNKILDY